MLIFFIMNTGEKISFSDLTGLPLPDTITRAEALMHVKAAMHVDDRIINYEILDSQQKTQVHHSDGNCNCYYIGKCG